MGTLFSIEDEAHAEMCGDFPSMKDALAELRRRAAIPWDQEPNVTPCNNWKTCGRRYEIVEFETAFDIEFEEYSLPWTELRRYPVLDIRASGVSWSSNLQELDIE